MPARFAVNTPSKTRENEYEVAVIVDGTIDDAQAIGEAYGIAPAVYRGFPRRRGEGLRWTNRGIAEVTFTFGVPDEDKDEDPQGDQPTLGTLEIDGSGGTQHTNQCISQVAYPDGKFPDLVTEKVVGWHRDGVTGTDIDIVGSTFSLTKKWLPAAITGDYITNLRRLRGKTNKAKYTLQWAYQKSKYSIEFEIGELRFLSFKLKTDFTRSGIGIVEITYNFFDQENRENVKIGSITVPKVKGNDYVWTVYKKKEITNPPATIEVPEAVFVAAMYEEEDFKAKLGF